MNKKTLVHITTVPQTLSFFSGQLKYMSNKGFKVYVISSSGIRLQEFSEQEEVEYKVVNMSRDIHIFKDLVSLIKMIYILSKLKPDIVHSHTPKASLISMISSWLLRVPNRIYHVHGLVFETTTGMRRRILKLTEFISCLLSTQVYSVSNSLKHKLIKDKLCKETKLKVILNGTINGIDTNNRFKPDEANLILGSELRSELKIPDDHILIGFVGRFVKDKGIKDLIKVWNELKDEHNNINLMLIGEIDKRDAIPVKDIKILDKDKRVFFTGHVKNTVPYYAAMDLLVHPSYREGFGQVILEASSMELPIVAYDVTGSKDAVKNGETGVLVPPRDIKALKLAIKRYITNSRLRKSHGLKGRQRAVTKFIPIDIWKSMQREYENMIEKPKI